MDADQRRADARRRHELARAQAQSEAARAQVQLDEFVAQMHAAGAKPEPLLATLLNGNRVKTNREGWYLNNAQTLAVGPDASYYQLVIAGGTWARFTGVKLHSSPPTLEIGRGGRDGETGDLADFLARAREKYLPGT